MEFCRVSVEAHRHAATLYVAGFLAGTAAARAEDLVSALPHETSVLRVDLRAVDLIDPDSFVRVARALNCWRDATRGKVTIEFPQRSLRSVGTSALRLVPVQRDGVSAVSGAMI
jgi:hypothetical protein